MSYKSVTPTIHSTSHYLWFLTLAYTMVIVMANWFDARLIRIVDLVTDAGTLIFPLTFLLSDLITEVYGYKFARRAIWTGFLFNLLFILYGQLVIHLPSPTYPTNNALFAKLFALDSRIIIASAISYFCSEPLNSYLMAKLKIKLHGKKMAQRFIASTFIASGVDSFIFSFLAFYHTMTNAELLILIVTMWFFKIIIELVGLPFSIKISHYLKQKEQLDIYDFDTKFNLFSLDTNYSEQNNHYSVGN